MGARSRLHWLQSAINLLCALWGKLSAKGRTNSFGQAKACIEGFVFAATLRDANVVFGGLPRTALRLSWAIILLSLRDGHLGWG
jgi:hypothetical protein